MGSFWRTFEQFIDFLGNRKKTFGQIYWNFLEGLGHYWVHVYVSTSDISRYFLDLCVKLQDIWGHFLEYLYETPYDIF